MAIRNSSNKATAEALIRRLVEGEEETELRGAMLDSLVFLLRQEVERGQQEEAFIEALRARGLSKIVK